MLCTLLVRDYVNCNSCVYMLTGLFGFDMICLRSCDRLLEIFMEKSASVSLDALERGWLKQCIDTQRKVLMRSRQKEITGGEIWSLRGKEIDSLTALLAKVSV